MTEGPLADPQSTRQESHRGRILTNLDWYNYLFLRSCGHTGKLHRSVYWSTHPPPRSNTYYLHACHTPNFLCTETGHIHAPLWFLPQRYSLSRLQCLFWNKGEKDTSWCFHFKWQYSKLHCQLFNRIKFSGMPFGSRIFLKATYLNVQNYLELFIRELKSRATQEN